MNFQNQESNHSQTKFQGTDGMEARINAYLDKTNVQIINPKEKYHEYCEKKKALLLKTNKSLNLDSPKLLSKLKLSCSLYERRKSNLKKETSFA